MIKRLIGFSGVESSFRGSSVTNPWKIYERFFQYLRPMSSSDLSLNQGRTSLRIGHAVPSLYISTHGTCTITLRLSDSPLIPAKGNLIIARSTQKNVLALFASG